MLAAVPLVFGHFEHSLSTGNTRSDTICIFHFELIKFQRKILKVIDFASDFDIEMRWFLPETSLKSVWVPSNGC